MVEHAKKKIIIVGCGPGLKSYISPRSLYNINKADILIGSRRLLKLFTDTDADKITLEKNYKILLEKIALWRRSKQVVVLVSGDPCFFSYTKILVDEFGRDSCSIIPGISSIQLAFAAIGDSWDDACFISLHGRNAQTSQLIKTVRNHPKVAVLTDHNNTPAVIARQLLKHGIRKRHMFICENLSLPDEKIFTTDIISAVTMNTRNSAVVIIKKV
jgi:precorrin-6y C5,15-methyltransferase (decarboxylating) CbiE subunit